MIHAVLVDGLEMSSDCVVTNDTDKLYKLGELIIPLEVKCSHIFVVVLLVVINSNSESEQSGMFRTSLGCLSNTSMIVRRIE